MSEILKYFNEHNSDKVRQILNMNNYGEIINGIVKNNNNELLINYSYFKYIASQNTYDIIIQMVLNNIDNILQTRQKFIVHFNIKSLTVAEYDKHKSFISRVSDLLKNRYHDQLYKCYVYNPPFIFEQLYNLISVFIDKDTQKKIELVKNANN